ncbi:succinate dehydrogenase assembly factor 2 [Morganella morganii]|nr:succinate dehydrogenase assembly factor 2 [Morganella morganii]ETO44800.1 hypothetical protein X965_02225 [Morganella sp. EGD-HP17]OFV00402.1 hypothetical protein HMPREF3119_08260 [Morganella sp. HMSC11D09]KLO01943.1 hypothetical protein ABN09_13410 [Morganella morganii]MCT1588290.1 succinate dehydrogenase assembly factor 2 [Morganella morganii]MCW9735069.1 succinate dehydrogenase assembly factor 2 [Morganella morganii]
MRELDIAIMPFFQHEYDTLTDAQKQDFVQLLNCPDPDLFNWLMNKGRPDDEALYQIIRLIQERNQARMAAQNAAYYPD